MLGDIYFQRSEWKTSEEYLAKYVSFENNMASADEAWLKIGLSRERQERYVEAIEAFDRVLGESSTDSHRLHARFEKGQCLVAAGKLEEAERIFRQVVTETNDKRFAAFAENHLGAMAMRRKAYKEAAEHFERALGQATGTPVEADILLGYGKAQSADGRYAAAEETFARFLEKHATDARVSEARAQRAIALSRLERFEEALSVIETSEPGFKALHPALVSTLQYEKAWCLRKLERPAAKDAYQSLIAENVEPSLRANALLELADIETSAKRYEIAKTHLVKLKELIQAPSSSVSPDVQEQALHRLGVCEFQLDRFKEAAEALEEFLEKFAQSSLVASASAFCGEAWVKAGRDDRAVTHLSHVVERFPSDPAHSAALLRLGEAQATLQRWTQSENALTQYLERYPQSESWYQAQFGIGWARENQGRHDDAISAYRLVVERHKGATAARAQFQIGECLFAKKQYQDAAAELLKVDILYAYPEWSAAALYEAGRCFDKLTKPAESQAQFRMVIEKFGQTRWAALAKEHLAETNGNGPGSR